MELFRHRRAARDLAALDDFYAQAGACQISGASKAVVSGPDDDNIRLVHACFRIALVKSSSPAFAGPA